MKRRQFITLLTGGAAAGLPIAARAQLSPKQHRIAFVHSGISADKLTEATGPFWVRRFHETLRGLGDTEGSNLVIERFSAEGRADRFAALAAEVVSRNPDVIISNLNDLVKAFKQATTTIPIVAIAGDPIAGGSSPTSPIPAAISPVSASTRVLKSTASGCKSSERCCRRRPEFSHLLSSVWDAGSGTSYRQAGQQLGIEFITNLLPEMNETQLRRTFAEMTQQKMDAAIVDEGGSFLAYRALIVELAEKHRLPVMYPYRAYADLGGLVAYAPDLGELAQRVANDVHQVLNGTKAGDIPFYQPSKFQLIVNLKTSRTLGLTLPQSLVAGADEVIE